jgi:alpha-tubulin suppressor-like RCC1 family protein
MRAFVAVFFAILFVSGCTWSSAQPLTSEDAGIPEVSEDAAVNATTPPPDDGSLPFVANCAAALGGTSSVLAAGGQETCSVTSTNALWCWGSNVNGQLGTATPAAVTIPGATEAITGSFVPAQITSAGTAVTSVAVGDFHACALSKGTGGGSEVQCWGDNAYGQLGGGAATMSQTPVTVQGLTNVTAIAAGGYHTCALAGGSVMCWGNNADGQLGDGTTSNQSSPVAVQGLSGATAIVAGGAHTCALTSGGGVVCWGLNNYGQLGTGSTVNSSTPVNVSGLATGVKAIATGNSHTCALGDSGSVMCWGWNEYGQLGNNSTNASYVPVSVTGLSPATAIATGGDHTCAIVTGGAVWCWGNDQAGQLGDGQCIDSNVPVSVMAVSGSAIAIAAGIEHSCAMLTGGLLQCWGWNVTGQLGDGTGQDQQTAVKVCGF